MIVTVGINGIPTAIGHSLFRCSNRGLTHPLQLPPATHDGHSPLPGQYSLDCMRVRPFPVPEHQSGGERLLRDEALHYGGHEEVRALLPTRQSESNSQHFAFHSLS